jgi:dCMP deaminase
MNPSKPTHNRCYNDIDLENFVREHDEALYHGSSTSDRIADYGATALHSLNPLIDLYVINTFDSIEALYLYLDSANLLDADRLRPRWDTYFMASLFMTSPELASSRTNHPLTPNRN